ncbi:MAG TPA: class I SAM-dependent methyltransferase [Aliidongia sp.]|nr:class I SAM-dependent methyltransferase [Aliidongia sp.]
MVDATVSDLGDAAADAARRMDAMYRYQRHIYDLTRKFYLLGRDRLLASLPIKPGASVLEMGCGTGRNLVKLGHLAPDARLHGVDVASVMIDTAARALARAGLAKRVRLAQAGGQGFDPQAAFGLARFDVIYFSYVLSMIPDWRPVVERALAQLAPGGILAVVDFGDQQRTPAWRRLPLLAWLRLFDVHPRAEIERGLRAIAAEQDGLALDQDLGGGYAYLLLIRKS